MPLWQCLYQLTVQGKGISAFCHVLVLSHIFPEKYIYTKIGQRFMGMIQVSSLSSPKMVWIYSCLFNFTTDRITDATRDTV